MRKLREIWINDTMVTGLDLSIAGLPELQKIVLNHEDQLTDFASIRRSIKAKVWHFLAPGEGEAAELSGEVFGVACFTTNYL